MGITSGMKLNSLVGSIISIAAGIVLLVWPETTVSTICKAIGILAIVAGIYFVISYIRQENKVIDHRPNLASGIICLTIGGIILCSTELFVSIVPAILGFLVIVSGAFKLQNAFDYKKLQYDNWLIALILAIINLAFGIILVWNPFTVAKILFMCIGAGFVFSGVSEIIIRLAPKNYREVQ